MSNKSLFLQQKSMPKVVSDALVVKKQILNNKYFILELNPFTVADSIEAGQFLQLLIPHTNDVFLRRPFSIHDVTENHHIRLLVQVVGKGTQALQHVIEGEVLNIIYPLGNGFSFSHLQNKALLVGGGCGVAPLLLLARKINKMGIVPDIIIGTKSKADLIEIEEYQKLGNVFITTEDGSEGTKGYVTHHAIFERLEFYEQIYACGPEVMMKAVAKRAKEKSVPCQVSLENTMACGIGACLCCITPSVNGNVCVCTEGPVFNSTELLW